MQFFRASCATVLLAVLLAPSGLFADIVVEYGPSTTYVTASQPFQTRDTSASATYHTTQRGFSLGTPWLSSSGSYGGPTIYGGYYHALSSSASFSQLANQGLVREDSGQNDRIRSQSMYATTANVQGFTQNYAVVFAVTGSETYMFDEESSLNWQAYSAAAPQGSASMQFVVVDDGSVYVSASSYTWTTNTLTTYSLANPDEIMWAEWTPGPDLSMASLTYDVPGSSLDNITHAGYAINHSSTASGQNASTLDTVSFTADLAVVPEPGTVALLGLSLLGLSLARRRG